MNTSCCDGIKKKKVQSHADIWWKMSERAEYLSLNLLQSFSFVLTSYFLFYLLKRDPVKTTATTQHRVTDRPEVKQERTDGHALGGKCSGVLSPTRLRIAVLDQ